MLKVICVSGCVGSGKSTLLKEIAQKELLELGTRTYNVEVDLENVEIWQSEGLLESVYRDAASNGFFFQTFVLVEFAEKFKHWKQKANDNWIKNQHSTVVFCERCPFESKSVFMHLLPVAEIQKQTFSKLFDKLAWEPDFKVCLHPQKEVVSSRIASRDRIEEKNQDHFLEQCYGRYAALIENGAFNVVLQNAKRDDVFQHVKKFLDETTQPEKSQT